MTFQEAANILLCHLDGKRPVKKKTDDTCHLDRLHSCNRHIHD